MLLTSQDRLLIQPAFARNQPGSEFIAAVDSCLATLRARFPRYDEFLRRDQVPRDLSISTIEQIDRLPALFLPVLKSCQFALPADMAVTCSLTSSGTSGRPTVTPQDAESWRWRVEAMHASYRALNLFDGQVRALAFLMDPSTTKMAGSLVIDAVLRSAREVQSIAYLARMGANGPEFPLPAALSALQDAVAQGPVLLVGYPALIGAMMSGLASSGQPRCPLPPGSRILTGGGWKSFLPGITLDQAVFRQQAAEFFDLPPAAIRDMYGLSECPAVFLQCEHAQYHVPAWAWAQAVDPETGAEVAEGELGLLQLTVPLTTSYPLLKILTTDKALLHRQCACGRQAPAIQPLGRVSAARFETCAMKMGRTVG